MSTIAFSPAGQFGLVDDVARNEADAVSLSDGSAVLGFNPTNYAPADCAGHDTRDELRPHVRWLLEGERHAPVVQRLGV